MTALWVAGSAVLPSMVYAEPEEDLAVRVIARAVADAGLRRADIDGIISLRPREQASQQCQAQHVAARLALPIQFIAEVEAATLGMANAFRLARDALEHDDLRAIVIFAAHRESLVATADWFETRAMRTSDASFVGSYGMAPIAWNALAARQMLDEGEIELRQFADVAVRLRESGIANKFARQRSPVTADEVLASRLVADPLRLLMVCPRSDGAGAIVLINDPSTVRDRTRLVQHVSQATAHDGDNIIAEQAGTSMWRFPAATAAAERLLGSTGLRRDDLDLIEPWAPFTPMEIMIMRAIGFGDDYARQLSVSPSGGLLARGHPLLATAFYNVHEVITQLRGEASDRQVKDAELAVLTWETGNNNGCALDLFAAYAAAGALEC